MEMEGLVWTSTFKLFWQEKFIIIGHVRYSKSKPSFNMAWWLPKVKKGEVIGLERRFLCVSWFARYDKSFALDPFDQKKREREEWVMMLACFFFSNKNPSGWPAYRSHWRLWNSLNLVFFNDLLKSFSNLPYHKKTFWVLIFFFKVLLWTGKGYNMIDVSTK